MRDHGEGEWVARGIHEGCEGCEGCEAVAEANVISGDVSSGENEVRTSDRNLQLALVVRLKTPIVVGKALCAGREGRNQPREADIEGLRFL